MADLLTDLRAACAEVAKRALSVRIEHEAIAGYADDLVRGSNPGSTEPFVEGMREDLAAFWLTLDAINFGSGWFPTLRKRQGRSGYFTIAGGLRDRFEAAGPWRAAELETIDAAELAEVLRQDSRHELMQLYAHSLRVLGAHVSREHGGEFTKLIDSAHGSATTLVSTLARWALLR